VPGKGSVVVRPNAVRCEAKEPDGKGADRVSTSRTNVVARRRSALFFATLGLALSALSAFLRFLSFLRPDDDDDDDDGDGDGDDRRCRG